MSGGAPGGKPDFDALDAIAALALGAIERRVGRGDQGRDVDSAAGRADAHRRIEAAARNRPGGGLEGHANAFGGRGGIGEVARQHGHELFAAEPANDVGRAHVVLPTVEANRRNASSPT